MRQPMTNGFALLVHLSVCQKLNRVSSVQFSYVALHTRLKIHQFSQTCAKDCVHEHILFVRHIGL